MRERRRQQIAPHKLRRLFMAIGIPLGSMCLTFLVLYILIPVHTDSPAIVESTHTKLPQTVQAPTAAVPVSGPPVRLQILNLKIDTAVNPVGLTSTGAMDIDENPDQVAWYKFGAIPGQAGNAVIAGHYGWGADGHASVFTSLSTLKLGDVISVYDAKGIETDFAVRETRLYDPSSNAGEVFNASDTGAHLNLITCEGTWINEKDSYSNRLVVFTDLVQK